jgi:hypothetical protein
MRTRATSADLRRPVLLAIAIRRRQIERDDGGINRDREREFCESSPASERDFIPRGENDLHEQGEAR